MLDISILYLLLDINIYSKYYSVINLEKIKETNREVYNLILLLNSVFKTRDSSLSVEEFRLLFISKYPSVKEEILSVYLDIFDKMSSLSISSDVAEEYFIKYKERTDAHSILETALGVMEGRKDFADLEVLVENCKSSNAIPKNDVQFVSTDLQTLLDSTSNTPGLKWRLGFLNQSIGSLRQGNFGFLFARPETGKTTMLASEVSYMAQQLADDECVLWFNNEEVGQKVAVRVYQAVFGVSQHDLQANLDHYSERYRTTMGSRLRIIDNAVISRFDVERIVKQYKPKLIVFDQIDKIKGFDGDGVQLFAKIYTWARELAKTYCPVIGVCQASADGENELYLDMSHVDQSKTAKAAEADFMFGIGKDSSRPEFVRGISICKNKLGSDPDCVEAMRHGKKAVLIVPQHARYQDQ